MTASSSASRHALRVALFGSPEFALPTLEALRQRHQLLLVVAQPDKPSGRGLRSRAPAVSARARELALPLEQPARLKGNEAFAARLRAAELDVAVTAAYGKILPASLLGLPRHGFLNVHASLLPQYRGAAPVQWALIRGERETGVTIMQTDAGLDTGPIRLQRRLTIPPGATAPELLPMLARLGAEALLEALELLTHDALPSRPQDDALASSAPMLTREDGRIRWDDPAHAVDARHRGVAGWPGTRFRWQDQDVKALQLRPATTPTDEPGAGSRQGGAAPAGTVLALAPAGLIVACGVGSVLLEQVQPAGKRAMAARDWANGRGVRVGVRLG